MKNSLKMLAKGLVFTVLMFFSCKKDEVITPTPQPPVVQPPVVNPTSNNIVFDPLFTPTKGSAIYNDISSLANYVAPTTYLTRYIQNISNIVVDQGQNSTCVIASLAAAFKCKETCFNSNYISLQTTYNNVRSAFPNHYFGKPNNGLISYTALDYVKTQGIQELQNAEGKVTKLTNKLYLEDYYKIYDLFEDKSTIIQNLKNTIAQNLPIHASFVADNELKSLDSYLNDIDSEILNGGHAMIIYGYDNDDFLLINSWGRVYKNGEFTLKMSANKLLKNVTALYALKISSFCTNEAVTIPTPTPNPVVDSDIASNASQFNFGSQTTSMVVRLTNNNARSIDLTAKLTGNGGFSISQNNVSIPANSYADIIVYFVGGNGSLNYDSSIDYSYFINGVEKILSVSLSKLANATPQPVVINSSPALNSFSSSSYNNSNSCGLTFINGMRFKVISISETTTILEISKVDGSNFSFSGTLYLKNSICGTVISNYSYSSGISSFQVNLTTSRNTSYTLTATSYSNDRLNLGNLTIY